MKGQSAFIYIYFIQMYDQHVHEINIMVYEVSNTTSSILKIQAFKKNSITQWSIHDRGPAFIMEIRPIMFYNEAYLNAIFF